MHRSFLVLYISILAIILALIVNGIWFSNQVAGLSEAVNLAGSQRMRIYKIALLIANTADEASSGREAVRAQIKMEMNSFTTVLTALQEGSSSYRVRKFSDQQITQPLKRLATIWRTRFEPQFNAMLTASSMEERNFRPQDLQQIQSFVEEEIDGLVHLLVHKMNHAERLFHLSRSILTLLCALVLSFNFLYLRRGIIQPIHALLRDTEKMADGNHAVQAEVSTNNEFMLLAQRFNTMATAISSSIYTMEETIRQRSQQLTASDVKLQASANHMRLLMDSTGEGIYGLDMNGCCTFINKAGAAMVGYTPEELLGRNMHEVIHHSKADGSPYAEEECPIFRAFRSGVAAHIDREWLWRKDRSFLPVEYASYPIMVDGEITGAVVTFNNITEVIKAREERNKLFNAVEQSEESIVITDIKGAIEYVNPAFERKTGYTVNEALGQNPKILNSGMQSKEFYQEMWQTLSRGEIWSGELINRKKSGELYYEQATISPVKNERGETTHYVAIKNDISARKLAEGEILLKNRELERLNQMQAKMMRELKLAMHAAEDAARAKSSFLANMSHEIRTPMNAIMGMAHLLARTPVDARQLDYITKIDSSAKGLLGIINDILDFSKIEAGKLDLESVPFNLEDVLKNLSTVNVAKAQEKKLELLYNITSEVPMALVGDPLRLGQILINLTGNAIKFTKKGEVIVAIDVVDRSEASVLLRFSVHDSGIGMTEGQIASLFQAFSQADSSTTREFGGTGLGLTISKQLVQMMGGEIGVDSQYEHGSTFFFTARFACQPAATDNVAHNADFKDIPTLVVDDILSSRKILESMVIDMGFSVTVASSGEEALEIITHAQPPIELVLMDLCMPDVNGIEVSKRIKVDPRLSLLPTIIMVTGYDHQEITDQVDEICDGLLSKPFTATDLASVIMSALGRGAHQQLTSSQPLGYRQHLMHIKGARVLLAEDNEINQQVAREILEGGGVAVTMVNNGQDALKLASTGGFDLILMDIQMPVMDGMAATAAIRRLTSEARSVPIIAMTAHAMTGDREKSLTAGMDDHITKPIDPELLFATLARHIKPGQRQLPGHLRQRRNDLPSKSVPPLGDLPGINSKSGLARVGGNQTLYQSLLVKFRHDFRNTSAEVATLLPREEERPQLLRLIHTVKGVAANLGADELAAVAAELESAIKASPSAVASEVLNRFDTALHRLLAGLNALESNNDEAAPLAQESGSEEMLISLLDRLGPLLGVGAPKQCKGVMSEITAYTWPLDYTPTLRQLGTLINRYRFKEAEALLNELRGQITESANNGPRIPTGDHEKKRS